MYLCIYVYIYFCTPAVVNKLFWLCYECNCMNGVTNMFVMLSSGVKYRKKITANYNSFEKMNPINGL